MYFPDTRFLKNIQLKSQKQSQLKYKWLLALRLLFLASLILAFAQPFFNTGKKGSGNRLQVIYLDNSGSMSVKNGVRTLFETARDAARKQVQHAAADTRFVLITNDNPVNSQPQPADKILAELNTIDISVNGKTAAQLLARVHAIMQNESMPNADVYYYSDFQQNSFPVKTDENLLKGICFYGIPVQADAAQNIYIDTAYMDVPVLQTGTTNKLIVNIHSAGAAPKDAPVLQLSVNGQVKSASAIRFNDKNESVDTLSFSVNDAGWQHIVLTINDASVRFDDTFRIAAKSSPNLAVLVMNEGKPNPYIQAAFRAYNGFQLTQTGFNTNVSDWKQYSLVIFNGITHLNAVMGKAISSALQQGQTICLFPARTANIAALNEGLQQIADIHISAIDTVSQAATTLQEGSVLVKDLFEHIPDNVQLPVANWHYVLEAGLSANQQSILSFRNGSPLFAVYTPFRSPMYIAASAADLESGNFAGSYFFVPFLYQMAMQSGGGNVYAINAGKNQPVLIPFENAGERNMIHIYGKGTDAIPPQRPAGNGVEVFAGSTGLQAGFYSMSAAGTDTTQIALNIDRHESDLATWDMDNLRYQWKGKGIYWLGLENNGNTVATSTLWSFPLWKVCAILALLMLAAETYVLTGGFKKQAAAQ